MCYQAVHHRQAPELPELGDCRRTFPGESRLRFQSSDRRTAPNPRFLAAPHSFYESQALRADPTLTAFSESCRHHTSAAAWADREHLVPFSVEGGESHSQTHKQPPRAAETAKSVVRCGFSSSGQKAVVDLGGRCSSAAEVTGRRGGDQNKFTTVRAHTHEECARGICGV